MRRAIGCYALASVLTGPALASSLSAAQAGGGAPSTEERRWAVTAFGGVRDDSRFLEILSFRGGDPKSSYFGGLAVGRTVGTSFDHLEWEVEASLFQHFGVQTHVEGNLALVGRWTRFPWDSVVDTSIAFGQGVSLASRPPPLEEPDAQALLHHLSAEVELAPPGDSAWSAVGRVHHRSGVFGLYGTKGGSNFVTLGLRLRF